MNIIKRRPSPAMVVALIALFLSLVGVSIANGKSHQMPIYQIGIEQRPGTLENLTPGENFGESVSCGKLNGHQALAVAGGFNVTPNVAVVKSEQTHGFTDWQEDFKDTIGSGQAQASVICMAVGRTPAY